MIEKEVVIVFFFNKGLLLRKKYFEKLWLLGNYYYNLIVMEIGKGELIVYRCFIFGKGCNFLDFFFCNFCFGFIKC